MKKLHTYYVAEGYDTKQYNAGIVRNDNEKILETAGFTALKFRHTKEGSLPVKFLRICNAVQIAFSIKKNSLVVFHFPLLAKAYKWLLQILKWRGVKTVALIIDIDGIRDKDETLLSKEINLLQQFNYIIAHNPAMKKKLLEYLPAASISVITVFDYPFNGTPVQRELSNNICFAGSAVKATFVFSLNQLSGLHFNVYGHYYDAPINVDSFSYKGVVSPEILPAVLEGCFGLVWDGSSIENCDDYLRYNNPHKLSLYLVAGMPVIVWKDSAVAALAEENNIGFTVHSLTEIQAKLDSLTTAEYQIMQQQASIIGEKISKGFFLKKVMDEIKAL